MWTHSKQLRLCLFNKQSPVSLPIDGIVDVWKVEKVRLQQSYNSSKDEAVREIHPEVKSGRKWSAAEELKSAEDELDCDLHCEKIRGPVYEVSGFTTPHFIDLLDNLDSKNEKQS